jgi:DNA mismatch repair protein MutS
MSLQGVPFSSVLFEDPGEAGAAEELQVPDFFRDLHLDQVVSWALAQREEYNLASFFYVPLRETNTVHYRQEVCQDLDNNEVAGCVRAFAGRMRRARSFLKGMSQIEVSYFKQGWFLDAAENYWWAVTDLLDGLGRLPLRSRGLKGFKDYLDDHARSEGFVTLGQDVRELRSDLAGIQYSMLIRGTRVTVAPYEGEPDYSHEIVQTFAKFSQGAVKDFLTEYRDLRDTNHVQAQVLERVARLYPKIFARLEACYVAHHDFIDPTVRNFDREIQFYLAYLEFVQKFRDAGLPLCYPEVSELSKEVSVESAYDIALASTLVPHAAPVVGNDVELAGLERILVVTGPNQGGKTTFARMFGQLHFLASLGLPVLARRARLVLPDRIFTHFEREERLESLRGKLDDELVRVRDILAQATGRSVLVMNESFGSTTLADSLFIGMKVLQQVSDLGALSVYVTFVDELASLNEATVSIVAGVVPEDPDVRTYKLTRRSADGRAYAMALARKYGLTYASLTGRNPQ